MSLARSRQDVRWASRAAHIMRDLTAGINATYANWL